jgi:hypothetical protein
MTPHTPRIDDARTQILAVLQADCRTLMAAWRQAEQDGDDIAWWYLRRALNDRIRMTRELLGYPLHDPAWQVPWHRDPA